jgi:hypothetical protein
VQLRRSVESVRSGLEGASLRGVGQSKMHLYFGLPTMSFIISMGNRVSDSDESMVESEEDENVDPYPLEGKYKNEADREQYVSTHYSY